MTFTRSTLLVPALLAALLAKPVPGGTIVFANTRDQCDRLAEQLTTSGFECALYRGEMDKKERTANLKAFKEGRVVTAQG